MAGSMLKKITRVILAVLALVAAVVLLNTVRYSRQSAPDVTAADIAVDAEAAARRLAAAVRFETVSHEDRARIDHDAFRALHGYLEEAFPRVHATLSKEVVGELSLLYTWPGREPAAKPILLMAHLDVVPVLAGTEGDWTHPPYAGIVADGRIWGRGTLDNKSGVTGILEAVDLLLGEGFVPRQTVYLAFGHDEEIGGREGAACIAELLRSRGDELAGVLDEGGFLTRGVLPGFDATIAVVGIAEKGYLSLELSTEAAGGHSSSPPRNTAVGVLARAISRLEADPFPPRLDGATEAMFRSVGPTLPFAKRMVFANLWLFRPLVLRILAGSPATDAMIRTTTAATMVSGSEKENVLPIRASAVINFRILPGDTADSVTERVIRVIDDPRVAVAPRSNRNDPSPVSSRSTPFYQRLERSIHAVSPEDDLVVAPYLLIAQTDSRHFTPLSDAVYRFLGAKVTGEELDGFHGTDESIAVAEYERAIKVYYRFLRSDE